MCQCSFDGRGLVKAECTTVIGSHSELVVLCIFVLFYLLFVLCRSLYCLCVYMCTELLPPGDYPVAVKYIISYHLLHPVVLMQL